MLYRTKSFSLFYVFVAVNYIFVFVFVKFVVGDITENILMLFTAIWTEVGKNKIIIVNCFPKLVEYSQGIERYYPSSSYPW